MRAMMSLGPPGARPWTSVMARSGQTLWPRAGAAAQAARPASAVRRVIFGCARRRPHLGARRTRLPMTSSRLALFVWRQPSPPCTGLSRAHVAANARRAAAVMPPAREKKVERGQVRPRRCRRDYDGKRVRDAVSVPGRRSGRPRAPCACPARRPSPPRRARAGLRRRAGQRSRQRCSRPGGWGRA